MTEKRHFISEGATVREALQALNALSGESMTLFALDGDGRLSGTVTDGDIRRALISGSGLGDTLRGVILAAPRTSAERPCAGIRIRLFRYSGRTSRSVALRGGQEKSHFTFIYRARRCRLALLIFLMIMKRDWKTIREYSDILFDFFEGIARITINRPEVYNAFRPQTNEQILDALAYCRDTPEVRVVVLTGAGDKAFCSGGDQHYKSRGGYRDSDGTPRLNVLEIHKAIRSLVKPVIAMVNGYAIGGGNVLQVVCDLTIASVRE